MKVITESDDEHFKFIVEWMRSGTPTKEEFELIKQRLDGMGLTFEYGCCGHNLLRKKK